MPERVSARGATVPVGALDRGRRIGSRAGLGGCDGERGRWCRCWWSSPRRGCARTPDRGTWLGRAADRGSLGSGRDLGRRAGGHDAGGRPWRRMPAAVRWVLTTYVRLALWTYLVVMAPA